MEEAGYVEGEDEDYDDEGAPTAALTPCASAALPWLGQACLGLAVFGVGLVVF